MAEKISNRPYTVALTGGIGCGKSTVGEIFQKLGAHVLDADHVVHELLGPDSPLIKPLQAHFGPTIFKTDYIIDRTILGDIVFKSPEERKWLEALLHPKVYERLWEKAENIKTSYCMMLIPLLFESHHENDFDAILVVDVPESIQIERIKKRTDYNEEKIKQIIAAQISRQERLIKADDVIDNSSNEKALREQALLLHEKYLALAKVKKTAERLL